MEPTRCLGRIVKLLSLPTELSVIDKNMSAAFSYNTRNNVIFVSVNERCKDYLII